MQEFDPVSLEKFNGHDGQPAYVAYKGKVFDVTKSPMWKKGLHMNMHFAGRDLSNELAAAPHGPENLDKHPQIGILIQPAQERKEPQFIMGLLERHPFLRRHPHPSIVHFPVALMISTTLFFILYLATGNTSFKSTSFNCLWAGIIFSLPAMLSGYFTWWLNYHAKPITAVKLKIRLSFIMLAVSIMAFWWEIIHPEISPALNFETIVYLILLFALIPIVSAIGWYGATLTLPMEKKEVP
jgi:predicted heme/steroid binding protein/uncharacterized membrane protein